MTNPDEDDVSHLIQLQTILLLLLWAFSSLSNISASTPAAKLHQTIVFIGRLAGWSDFDGLQLTSREFVIYGTAHAKLLCVCVCVAGE